MSLSAAPAFEDCFNFTGGAMSSCNEPCLEDCLAVALYQETLGGH